MSEKKTNLTIAAFGVVALLLILGWWTQLRIERARMGDESIDSLFAQLRDDMAGKPVGDMGGMAAGASGLPVLGDRIPEFRGIEAWLNSEPLAPEDLEGKVVLVDFWTYSCINCIRTLPYVTALDAKYADKGLLIVGMHTPEFAFEKDIDNVRNAIERHGIEYPVALDNGFETWNAFNNRYWPAKYLFDVRGRLRYAHFGEGEYEETERAIQALLEEAGMEAAENVIGFESDVDFRKIGTRETYIGYKRLEALGSPEALVRDQAQTYSAPDDPERNLFYLDGSWIIGPEAAQLDSGEGSITIRYFASDANLVMGGDRGPVRVEVTLDGAPVPEGHRGDDIVVEDGKTIMVVDEEDLYSIIRSDVYEEHLLELRFLDEGVSAYAWTFG